jgi:hypothetical protein
MVGAVIASLMAAEDDIPAEVALRPIAGIEAAVRPCAQPEMASALEATRAVIMRQLPVTTETTVPHPTAQHPTVPHPAAQHPTEAVRRMLTVERRMPVAVAEVEDTRMVDTRVAKDPANG